MSQQHVSSALVCTDCEAQLFTEHPEASLRIYHCEGCNIPLCQRCFRKVGLCLKCEGC